jgi:predicted CoA-binding protein
MDPFQFNFYHIHIAVFAYQNKTNKYYLYISAYFTFKLYSLIALIQPQKMNIVTDKVYWDLSEVL